MTVKLFVSECLGQNERGHLTIGGCDTIQLAKEFGTPLYVMDENQIRKNCRLFRNSIEEFYGGHGAVAFASKSFSCLAMCRIVAEENLWLDVVSEGEMFTALTAGFPAERILFHGNNKTPEELAYAVREGIGRIVVDNVFELGMLDNIAKAAKKRVKIQLRVKPGVDAHTHEFVQTGCIDSKFGFALQTGEAIAAIREAAGMEYIEVAGIHCHIGSQIFDIAPFGLTATIMLRLMADARDALGYELAELNLGGGFGIKYVPEHNPVTYDKYMRSVADEVKKACADAGLKTPFIIIEPGRAISGPAGITLYTVGAIKEIPNIRTYLTVDGGMTDNPRYALYHSEYDMFIANRANESKSACYTVAGRCCESGDLLGENVRLQPAKVGDILAVAATGAYNYSMASNYNRLPKPAVVMVNDGAARLVVKRESLEDIIRNDVL